MTEIDIASDQEHAERGGTAATDLQLESEQRAMQALYDYQNAARTDEAVNLLVGNSKPRHRPFSRQVTIDL